MKSEKSGFSWGRSIKVRIR